MSAHPFLLVCALGAALAASEGPGIALAQRGLACAGPAQVQARGVTVAGTALTWADLAVVAFPGRPARVLDGGVITQQGEVLRGQPVAVDDNALLFAGDLHGELRLPLSTLAAIIFAPSEMAELPRLISPGADLGVRLSTGERVVGTLTFCNVEAVGIDNGRRVVQVPRARVVSVVLGPLRPPPAAGRTWLALDSGDRLAAQTLALSPAGLAITGPVGQVTVATDRLLAAWNEHGRLTHLGRTAPTRSSASDRAGATLPVLPGIGFPATWGGLAALDGVRLPARGEIAWPCADHAVFLAWAVCPAGGAATVARVELDGATAWEQTLQPGAAPVAVALPLKGAADIGLRALPTADGETATRAIVWCHPVLVK